MTLQILKSVDLKKKKNKDLDILRTKHFFYKKKKKIKGYFIAKNSFVEEVTFKTFCLQ